MALFSSPTLEGSLLSYPGLSDELKRSLLSAIEQIQWSVQHPAFSRGEDGLVRWKYEDRELCESLLVLLHYIQIQQTYPSSEVSRLIDQLQRLEDRPSTAALKQIGAELGLWLE